MCTITKDMNTENNKLIAEFLGWDVNNPSTFPTQLHQEEELQGFWELRFDTDWNWLIEAVEKIEHIDSIDVNILTNGTRIYEWRTGGEVIVDNSADISFEHKIEHVYDAVVKFIKWYK